MLVIFLRIATNFISSPLILKILLHIGANSYYTTVSKIQCSVSSNTTVNITWRKNGQHVDEYVGASEITVSDFGIYVSKAST